jgi:hypothetical protein
MADFPADDAAGQTVAAIAESEKISAGTIRLPSSTSNWH